LDVGGQAAIYLEDSVKTWKKWVGGAALCSVLALRSAACPQPAKRGVGTGPWVDRAAGREGAESRERHLALQVDWAEALVVGLWRINQTAIL
jgi:hypothetical protein